MVLDQPDPTVRMTLDDARSQLEQAVSLFFSAAPRKPVTWGIKAPVGIGKTEIVLRHVQAEIARMLAARDERVIVMAVPNHRLSRALMHRAREKGISVEVWRGFERRDIDDEPMCKTWK